MNTHNYIDNKIKELADYQPDVQPDWTGFYTRNAETIQQLTSVSQKTTLTRMLKSALFRNSLIVVSLMGLFITAYIFYQQPGNPGNGVNQPVPAKESGASPVVNHPSDIPQNENPDSDKSDNQTNDPNVIPQKSSPANVSDPGKSTSVTSTPELIRPSDSVIEKPVIIRKTVIKYDTIRKIIPGKKDF